MEGAQGAAGELFRSTPASAVVRPRSTAPLNRPAPTTLPPPPTQPVVDAVHKEGSIIYLQLWHMGRTSHSSFNDGECAFFVRSRRGAPAPTPCRLAASLLTRVHPHTGKPPVGPSPIAAKTYVHTADGGKVDCEVPRELTLEDITRIIGVRVGNRGEGRRGPAPGPLQATERAEQHSLARSPFPPLGVPQGGRERQKGGL